MVVEESEYVTMQSTTIIREGALPGLVYRVRDAMGRCGRSWRHGGHAPGQRGRKKRLTSIIPHLFSMARDWVRTAGGMATSSRSTNLRHGLQVQRCWAGFGGTMRPRPEGNRSGPHTPRRHNWRGGKWCQYWRGLSTSPREAGFFPHTRPT